MAASSSYSPAAPGDTSTGPRAVLRVNQHTEVRRQAQRLPRTSSKCLYNSTVTRTATTVSSLGCPSWDPHGSESAPVISTRIPNSNNLTCCANLWDAVLQMPSMRMTARPFSCNRLPLPPPPGGRTKNIPRGSPVLPGGHITGWGSEDSSKGSVFSRGHTPPQGGSYKKPQAFETAILGQTCLEPSRRPSPCRCRQPMLPHGHEYTLWRSSI